MRYALGRKTYMPRVLCDLLTPLVPRLTSGDLNALSRDIERCEALDFAADAWEALRRACESELAARRGDCPGCWQRVVMCRCSHEEA